MLLHILRHAHAGDPAAYDGPDAERPLSEKGRRQAERLGRFLADRGTTIDLVVTSPKVRAAQTAEIVAEHLSLTVVTDARLGELVDLATVEAILAEQGQPRAPMLVGHDPDCSELVATLIGAADIEMRKGALARIEVELPLSRGAGTLRWLVPPDALSRER